MTDSGDEALPQPVGPLVEYDVSPVVESAAQVEDVVLRETKTVRLVLRTKIVQNSTAPDAGVDGKLLYQRKTAASKWSDVDPIKLSSVKSGEAVAINLSSVEMFLLRNGLNDLQSIKDSFGVPTADVRFIGIRESTWAERMLGKAPEKTLLIPAEGSMDSLAEALGLLFRSKDLGALVEAIAGLPSEAITSVRLQVGLSDLDKLLEEWNGDPDNSSEEHWQQLFSRYPFVLEQIFHAPTILMQSKAYVGGKTLGNSGGKFPDFVLKTVKTNASAIVEIKTPTSRLLHGTEYRGDVWRASEDLSGSIVQALTYRDYLVESLPQVAEDNELLRRVLPRCVVIVGSTVELDTKAKACSFERIRARRDVEVLTFDEVHDRLVGLREIMAAGGVGDGGD